MIDHGAVNATAGQCSTQETRSVATRVSHEVTQTDVVGHDLAARPGCSPVVYDKRCVECAADRAKTRGRSTFIRQHPVLVFQRDHRTGNNGKKSEEGTGCQRRHTGDALTDGAPHGDDPAEAHQRSTQ